MYIGGSTVKKSKEVIEPGVRASGDFHGEKEARASAVLLTSFMWLSTVCDDLAAQINSHEPSH